MSGLRAAILIAAGLAPAERVTVHDQLTSGGGRAVAPTGGRGRVLGDALEALRLVAIYASPAIPGAVA